MASRSDPSQMTFWFVLMLVGVAILALPAMVLMFLFVVGDNSFINGWLQNHLNLSDHPEVPWWAGLLALLVPILLILLYFLKLKRRPLQVPSTFLWKKSYEDLHVNSLFQWLRRNILLLLQLLIVLAILYAILDPVVHGRTSATRHYIIMIDNSGSMSATDVAPSRLEQARKAAIAEIDTHTDNDFGMIIVFNTTAQILRSYTNDRGSLRLAITRDVQQTACGTNFEQALKLADSLANPNRPTDADAGGPTTEMTQGTPTRVHVYSDGRFADIKEFGRGNLQFEYHPIGRLERDQVNNLGIVTFNAVRDEVDRRRLLATVHVANYRAQPAKVRVRLAVSVNGRPRDPQEVELDIAEMQRDKDVPTEFKTFEMPDIEEDQDVILHAVLVDNKDDLALDDEAWLVVGVVRKAHVLIVGGDRVLHAFFDQPATRRVAKVEYIKPSELSDEKKYGQRAHKGEFDLVIFDGAAPEKVDDMPAANTWFIDCLPPPWKKADMPQVRKPAVKMNRHPLLRGLSALEEVIVFDAFLFDMTRDDIPPRSPRLFETDANHALLFLRARQSFTDVVQTFPFFNAAQEPQTDWFLHLGFPTFMRNVLYSLGNVEDGINDEVLRAGQQKVLRPDDSVEEIRIITPQGGTETLKHGKREDNSFLFGKTDALGVYDVQWDGKTQRRFAVNLLDADESDLEVRPSLKIGDEEVQAGEVRSQPRQLWPYFVMAALGLSLVEWFVYIFRVYV